MPRLSASTVLVSPAAPGTERDAAPTVDTLPRPPRSVPTVSSAISATVSWAVSSARVALPAATSARVMVVVFSVWRGAGAASYSAVWVGMVAGMIFSRGAAIFSAASAG